MIRQRLVLGDNLWYIIILYLSEYSDATFVSNYLRRMNCPEKIIRKSLRVLGKRPNTGLTFTNTKYKQTLVCVGMATSKEQLLNTVVHEAKHVLSHVCSYYNVPEDGETAAYLIGHIVLRMCKTLNIIWNN